MKSGYCHISDPTAWKALRILAQLDPSNYEDEDEVYAVRYVKRLVNDLDKANWLMASIDVRWQEP